MPKKRPERIRPIKPGVIRRCDNCPQTYTPKKSDHRFHSPECRADFHKFGPVFLRLDNRIGGKVSEKLYPFWKVLDQQQRARFKTDNPDDARLYEARSASEQ